MDKMHFERYLSGLYNQFAIPAKDWTGRKLEIKSSRTVCNPTIIMTAWRFILIRIVQLTRFIRQLEPQFLAN